MRAIILAAGVGARLNPLTNNCPKCLLPVGEQTLIDYQIEALRAVEIDDIVLVVGYQADQIRDHCGEKVRYIENPDYLTTNSIYSFYLARRELDTDIFLFNCDILFQPEVLRRMLDAGHPNVVAVDSRVQRIANEMNVVFDREKRISIINKEVDPLKAQAQSVQLVKFDAAGARLVRGEIESLINLQKTNVFPTSAYKPILDAGLLFAEEVGDLPWAEIDTLEDYENALEKVLPKI